MDKIWVVRFVDGASEVYDCEQKAPAYPYVDALAAEEKIAELEAEIKELREQLQQNKYCVKCSARLNEDNAKETAEVLGLEFGMRPIRAKIQQRETK